MAAPELHLGYTPNYYNTPLDQTQFLVPAFDTVAQHPLESFPLMQTANIIPEQQYQSSYLVPSIPSYRQDYNPQLVFNPHQLMLTRTHLYTSLHGLYDYGPNQYGSYSQYPLSNSSHDVRLPRSPASPALPIASHRNRRGPAIITSKPNKIISLCQNCHRSSNELTQLIVLSRCDIAASPVTRSQLRVNLRAEERLETRREADAWEPRREAVACTLCRDRKIACQIEVGTKAEVDSLTLERRLKAQEEGLDNFFSRPVCSNCIRLDRACIYPKQLARNLKRRRQRRAVSPGTAASLKVIMPSSSSGSSTVPLPVDSSGHTTSLVLTETRQHS